MVAGHPPAVFIRWHGYSCYEFADASHRLVVDPHDGKSIGVWPPKASADVVLCTHDSYDRNAFRAVKGVHRDFVRALGWQDAGGFKFKGMPSFADSEGGAKRGPNSIYAFEMDGVSIAFCGCLGDLPSEGVMDELRGADIMFVPVGEFGTMPVAQVDEFVSRTGPKVVVPTDFRIGGITLPLSPLSDFMRGKDEGAFVHVGNSVELTAEDISEFTGYWVFDRRGSEHQPVLDAPHLDRGGPVPDDGPLRVGEDPRREVMRAVVHRGGHRIDVEDLLDDLQVVRGGVDGDDAPLVGGDGHRSDGLHPGELGADDLHAEGVGDGGHRLPVGVRVDERPTVVAENVVAGGVQAVRQPGDAEAPLYEGDLALLGEAGHDRPLRVHGQKGARDMAPGYGGEMGLDPQHLPQVLNEPGVGVRGYEGEALADRSGNAYVEGSCGPREPHGHGITPIARPRRGRRRT